MPTSAQAATVDATATIDLTSVASLTNIFEPLDQIVAISAGDSVTYDVTFANNQALRFTATSSGASGQFWINTLNTVGTHYQSLFSINNINLSLSGFSTDGTFVNPTLIAPVSQGQAHIGPNAVNFGLSSGQFISFTGFSLSYDVVSLTLVSGSLGPPVLYDDAWLTFRNVTASIVDAPTVPIPAALPLFATGLGLMGLLGWRRKRPARAARNS
jgi:hypothetical protein